MLYLQAAKVPAKETSAVVPDLQEGEKYEFRVAAVNEAGPGKFTSPTPVVTAEDKPGMCKGHRNHPPIISQIHIM